jgi:hypothetical protein
MSSIIAVVESTLILPLGSAQISIAEGGREDKHPVSTEQNRESKSNIPKYGKRAFGYIPLPLESHPNANRLKASEIEQKIGVNIEFNIDPDFLFDLRELLIRFA